MKGKLVIALLYFFGHLPLRLNHAIGGFLGWILWLFPTRAKTTTLTNLQLCFPEKDAHWIKNTARQSLIETGKTLTESPFLWFASAQRIQELITAVSDIPALEDAVNQGRGAILVSPPISAAGK